MIAVDTNILIYAHRVDFAWHPVAAEQLTRLAESGTSWAIPWPCAHEFFAKVTHPRIFNEPTSSEDALSFLAEIAKSDTVAFLAESDGFLAQLERLVRAARVVGPMIHDARIAAICMAHGVAELWTADRDFGRFPGLKLRNPLIES